VIDPTTIPLIAPTMDEQLKRLADRVFQLECDAVKITSCLEKLLIVISELQEKAAWVGVEIGNRSR